jgi:hypothetical protein
MLLIEICHVATSNISPIIYAMFLTILPPEISKNFPPSSPHPYMGTYPAAWPAFLGQKGCLCWWWVTTGQDVSNKRVTTQI